MRERDHKSLMARGWRYSSIGKMLDGMPETLGLIPSPAEARHGITVLQSYHWEGRDRMRIRSSNPGWEALFGWGEQQKG